MVVAEIGEGITKGALETITIGGKLLGKVITEVPGIIAKGTEITSKLLSKGGALTGDALANAIQTFVIGPLLIPAAIEELKVTAGLETEKQADEKMKQLLSKKINILERKAAKNTKKEKEKFAYA